MIKKTKKPVSVLLSLLMLLSVFGGMAFTANAEDQPVTVTWTTNTLKSSRSDTIVKDGVTMTAENDLCRIYDDFLGFGDITFTAPEGFAFTKIVFINCIRYEGNLQDATVVKDGGYLEGEDPDFVWYDYYTVTWPINKQPVVSFKAVLYQVSSIVFTMKELTAEEIAALDLEEAKTAAKASLDNYKNFDDYRDAQKKELEDAIAEGKAAIDAAGNKVAVVKVLSNAKAAIDAIPTDAELTAKEADDEAAAKAVDELIAAIGEVAYTDESKALIDAAREAYEDLTDGQKALVENYGTLEAAEEEYARLKAEAEKQPETPASEGPGVCELCGEVHDTTTVTGFFTDFLHDLLFVLKQLTVGFAKYVFS